MLDVNAIILQVELTQALLNTALAIITLATLAGVIWRVAVNDTNRKNDIANLQKDMKDIVEVKEIAHAQLEKEIVEIRSMFTAVSKDADIKAHEVKLEMRGEVGKVVGNQVDKFMTIQRQIDGLKVELKDVNTRVTVVDTKMTRTEVDMRKGEKRLDDMVCAEKAFFEKWNQRIEDRVESLRKTFDNFMNMNLLNLKSKDEK